MVGYDLCSGRGSWLYSTTSQPSLSFTTASPDPESRAAVEPDVRESFFSPDHSDVRTVTLSSNSGTGMFATSTAGPWAKTLPLTIPAGQTGSPVFYYEDSTAGSPTLTASAAGITSGSQSETVNPASLSAMTVTIAAGTLSKKGPNYHVPLTVTAKNTSTTAPH